jgi:hypothetical protein
MRRSRSWLEGLKGRPVAELCNEYQIAQSQYYRLGGDSFHYARNVDLPGYPSTDPYTFIFFVNPPDKFDLAFHSDFRQAFGDRLFEPVKFKFSGIRLAQ